MKLIFNLDKRKSEVVFYDQEKDDSGIGVIGVEIDPSDYETLESMLWALDCGDSLKTNRRTIGCLYQSTFYEITGYDMQRVYPGIFEVYLTVREIEPLGSRKIGRRSLTGSLRSRDGLFEAIVKFVPSDTDIDEGFYVLQEIRDYGDWIYDSFTKIYHNAYGSKRDKRDLDRLLI